METWILRLGGKKVNLSKIVYNRRFNLGDYQHEDITVEYAFEIGDKTTLEEAILKVRQGVAVSNTLYLRQKQQNKKE